jgi:putative hydrolase of the HAD superfamily
MERAPKAVIFDLYETLITNFDPSRRRGPSVAQRLGLDEHAFAQAWAEVYQARNSGEIPDYRGALRQAAELLGHLPDEDLIRQLDRAHTAGHERAFLRLERDIVDMVRALKAASVSLGLVSNTTPEEVTGWDGCELVPYFDAVVFSYEVGLVKPDLRIYELACERLGVPPSSVVFVGDGGDHELAGAAAAGLTPWWATWFLQRWPNWQTRFDRRDAHRFRQVSSPDEVVSAACAAAAT